MIGCFACGLRRPGSPGTSACPRNAEAVWNHQGDLLQFFATVRLNFFNSFSPEFIGAANVGGNGICGLMPLAGGEMKRRPDGHTKRGTRKDEKEVTAGRWFHKQRRGE